MVLLTLPVDNLDLGIRIRLARVARRWTQAQLCSLVKCPQVDISRIERGLPISPESKMRILRQLNIKDEEESENENK